MTATAKIITETGRNIVDVSSSPLHAMQVIVILRINGKALNTGIVTV